MPRTKLDPQYAETAAKNRFFKQFMDTLNATRGRDRQTFHTFSQRIGVSESTLAAWNRGELERVKLGYVFTAAYRAGYRLKLEPINEVDT